MACVAGGDSPRRGGQSRAKRRRRECAASHDRAADLPGPQPAGLRQPLTLPLTVQRRLGAHTALCGRGRSEFPGGTAASGVRWGFQTAALSNPLLNRVSSLLSPRAGTAGFVSRAFRDERGGRRCRGVTGVDAQATLTAHGGRACVRGAWACRHAHTGRHRVVPSPAGVLLWPSGQRLSARPIGGSVGSSPRGPPWPEQGLCKPSVGRLGTERGREDPRDPAV